MALKFYQELALIEESRKKHLYAIASDGDHLEGERKRLNFQHNSLTTLFDGKLVLTPVSFSKGDRILDCGTGTGIWATEVARNVPDVLVEGTDISTRFFPLPGEISAVTFHNLSTFDLPPQWENRFNLVNQRLMVMCFSRAQWEAALQNIHRALKPGGWVQLIEVKQRHDFSATHPRFQRLLNATQTMMKERDFLIDPGAGLEEILKEGGFEEVIRTSKAAPIGEWGGDRGREALVWAQGAYKGMKGAILQAGGLESEDFDRMLREAFEECNEIPGLALGMEIVCGRKEV